MTRVAAFDCGTNSLRLLVCDIVDGRSDELYRDMRIVRLGENVDRTGRITAAALERVLGALDEFAAIADEHQVERIRFCATSAARDAENAGEFVAAVEQRLGVAPEVLSGSEEARLSFGGAVRSLASALPARAGSDEVAAGPYLVVDIGGGSTELILGQDAVETAASLDIGSVRLTERHLHSDPSTADEIAATRADLDAVLDATAVDIGAAARVVGVAGTVTTIAAGALGLDRYDRDVIHHAVLDVALVQATVSELLAMTVEERRQLGYMHPGRADVIAAGGLILDGLLRRARVRSLLVSEHDILDGIAWSLA